MTLSQRYDGVLAYFRQSGLSTKPELTYSDAFSLLVAVMLSAQCTDRRVNLVTPALMAAFPTPAEMAGASEEEILKYVSSVSYPNAKARHLREMAAMLSAEYGGIVPDSREALMALPGVGRKTANVILAVWFHRPAMPVDTHVFRVSNRLGLVSGVKTPTECELSLMRHIPAELCADAHHWLLLHGRYTCLARKPLCDKCEIKQYCKYHAKKI